MDIGVFSPYGMIRKGLCALIAQMAGVRIVADADSALGSLETIKKARPEILLLDSTNPGNDLDAICKLRKLLPGMKILLLVDTSGEEFDLRAIRAGAQGSISKRADPLTLERALRVVGKGEIWASHRLATRLIEKITYSEGSEDTKSAELTNREWENLACVAQGYRNKEIAEWLSISENTVKAHLSAIYRKLGITTRLEAALCFFHEEKSDGHQSGPHLVRTTKKELLPLREDNAA